jgi:hypothetical protein
VWVVSSEVFDLGVRAQGTSLGVLTNWAANAVIGKAVPLMVEAWGGAAFAVFAVCCAAGGGVVWRCLPETAGVALEDMGALFGEERGLARVPSFETAAAAEAAAAAQAPAGAGGGSGSAGGDFEEQGLM